MQTLSKYLIADSVALNRRLSLAAGSLQVAFSPKNTSPEMTVGGNISKSTPVPEYVTALEMPYTCEGGGRGRGRGRRRYRCHPHNALPFFPS